MDMQMRVGPVKSGSMVSINDRIGISHLERFAAYKLGNYVNLKIHWHKDTCVTRPTIEKAVKFCVENHIYFSFSEFLDRYTFVPWKILDTLTEEDWLYFRKLGGRFYMGCHSICERGGSVYWPLGYKHDNLLPEQTDDVKEAHDLYVAAVKKAIETEQRYGRGELECIDSSLLHKYHLEAGMESVALEMFPGSCDLMFPAVRGASRGSGRESFGVDVAMVWYGGVKKDELWFKRWQMSLYYAYLAGADWIISETGEFGMASAFGQKHDIDGPVCSRYRSILQNFFSYADENPRPACGPAAGIGIVHGKYDGTGGLWNREVWGQYKNDSFLESDPENSWKHISALLKKSDWFDACRTGDHDFSGNPPMGQFDVIPSEAPLEILQKYPCLVFLGWNTMDEELYDKLRQYVSNGGRLFMTLGHFNISTDRSSDITLFNDGDLSELFGVKITGRGELIRHSGIKITGATQIPGYVYPDWTENADPKWMDTVIPSADVELAGAEVIAQVAQVFGAYQLREKSSLKVLPAMTEFAVGRGFASLVTLWGYPGSTGIEQFFSELVRCICAGEISSSPVKVCASDKIRYAVYEEPDCRRIFMLNTDFDLPQSAKIFSGGGCRTVTVPPAEMQNITTSK